MDMKTENERQQSLKALARRLAPDALSRVGELIADQATDGRLIIQAARLILWAAGSVEDDEEGDGTFELRLTGGAGSDT